MKKTFHQLEQVVITGKSSERQAAWDYIQKNGFRSSYSGPLIARGGVPRFKIIATRIIRKGKA